MSIDVNEKEPPKYLIRRMFESGQITGNGCVELNISVDNTGYARIAGRKAHRAIWEWLYGPLGDGLVLDHLCRNKMCVNPEHLDPVSVRENTIRGESLPAQNSRKDVCKHGHTLSGNNITEYGRSKRWRVCRICHCAKQMVVRKQNSFRGGRAIATALDEQASFLLSLGRHASNEAILWDAVEKIKMAKAAREEKDA